MPIIQFKGIDQKTDLLQLSEEYATEAEDVITQNGSVRKRLGRNETGEEQLNAVPVLGVASYRPSDSGNEVLIYVTETGVFRRQLS